MIAASTIDIINSAADQCEIIGDAGALARCALANDDLPGAAVTRTSPSSGPTTSSGVWTKCSTPMSAFGTASTPIARSACCSRRMPTARLSAATTATAFPLPCARKPASKSVSARMLPAANKRLLGADRPKYKAEIAEHRWRDHLCLRTISRTFINHRRNSRVSHPKVVTVAAAHLFPSGLRIEAMGKLGDGVSTEVWWTPAFPFKSSLTGGTQPATSPRRLGKAAQKKQWTQPLGYSHALWEVAIDTLKRAKDPTDHASIRDALKAMADLASAWLAQSSSPGSLIPMSARTCPGRTMGQGREMAVRPEDRR